MTTESTENKTWREIVSDHMNQTSLLGAFSQAADEHQAADESGAIIPDDVQLVAACAVIRALQTKVHHLEDQFFLAEMGGDFSHWSYDSSKVAAWVYALDHLEREAGGLPYMAAARRVARHFVENIEEAITGGAFQVVDYSEELSLLRKLLDRK